MRRAALATLSVTAWTVATAALWLAWAVEYTTNEPDCWERQAMGELDDMEDE
jgi:hypothetical protein